MKYTTTIQPADRHDEIEIVVEYDYHKGSPGRLSGPPENCYPAEPAYVEIISVMHNGVDIERYLHDDTMIDIEQAIEDHVTGQAAADEQDYWDNVRKERRHELTEVIQEDCE
jgi:predicted secreted Zn-dependent protease